VGFTKKRTKIQSKTPPPKKAPDASNAPNAPGQEAGAQEEAGSDTPMLDAVAGQGGSEPPPEGSSLVVHSAGENEAAADGQSYTQDLLADAQDNPDVDIDDLARGRSDQQGHSHADHAQTGKKDVADNGKKAAVYVGNATYSKVPVLPGAARDAAGMHGTWSGKGYQGGLVKDQTGDGISGAFQGALKGLGPGDRALVYYAGHGTEQGLLGVDYDPFQPGADLAPHALVQGLVQQAEARGFHLTAILDACQSGAATARVTEDRLDELDSESEPEIVRNLAKVGKLIVRGRRKVMKAQEAERAAGGRGFERDDSQEDRGLERSPAAGALRKAHVPLSQSVGHYRTFTEGDAGLDGVLPELGTFVEGGCDAALDVVDQMSRVVLDRIERHRTNP